MLTDCHPAVGEQPRLRAWEETAPLPDADISINTADVPPVEAAAAIHRRLHARHSNA
ncbi:MAG: hypothetical protein JO115_02990 [Pseudonocardiales bacterium]|nr:hypothetical protein [Pseudonocardiales bacterium]